MYIPDNEYTFEMIPKKDWETRVTFEHSYGKRERRI